MIHPARIASLAIVAIMATSALVRGQGVPAPAPAAPMPAELARVAPVTARHGMVASQEKRATRIGVEVLEQGGNAVDAAVAVGFALAVTHPIAGNIGGRGFMVV